jgi:hypothetical protein
MIPVAMRLAASAKGRRRLIQPQNQDDIMRSSKAIALTLIVAASSLVSLSSARAASECPVSGTLSEWGVNSTGYVTIAAGGSCLFPIRIAGEMKSSGISQKPAHGTLKRLNVSTYVYTAKAGYKGNDTFSVQATGKGPTAFGTSTITMNATIQ